MNKLSLLASFTIRWYILFRFPPSKIFEKISVTILFLSFFFSFKLNCTHAGGAVILFTIIFKKRKFKGNKSAKSAPNHFGKHLKVGKNTRNHISCTTIAHLSFNFESRQWNNNNPPGQELLLRAPNTSSIDSVAVTEK